MSEDRGYVGQIPTLPLFEVMGVDFAESADKVNAFTHKLWPQGNNSFRYLILVLKNLDWKYIKL